MLMLTQLNGFMAGGALPPPSISLTDTVEDPGDNSTYTFTSRAIGAADATRRVVVVCHWSRTTAVVALSSATIAGVSATIHVDDGGSGLGGRVAIISALVPTGTTATVVLNFATTQNRAFIAVYRAINESSASPFATASDNTVTGNQFDTTINIPGNGWVVAGVNANQAGSGMTWTLTGVTIQYQGAYSDAGAVSRAGGFDTGLSAQTGRSMVALASATPVGGGLCAMSWG